MPDTAPHPAAKAVIEADDGTAGSLHVTAAGLVPRCAVDLLKAQQHVENGSVNLAVTLLSKYRHCGDERSLCPAMNVRCGIPEMLERVFGEV